MSIKNYIISSIFIQLFSVFISGQVLSSAPLKVVSGSNPDAIVVISDNPSRIANYAASEFVLHVKKSTGVELNIVAESQSHSYSTNKIYIGNTSSASQEGLNTNDLGPDACILRTINNNLYILGKESLYADPLDESNHSFSGTLFGVYELLERYLNIRWLWPGELGTYVPVLESISFDSLNEIIAPKLKFREFRWWDIAQVIKNYPNQIKNIAFSSQGLQNYTRDLNIFTRRHRISHENKLETGHFFNGWWEKYGETNPDWFYMKADGTRGPSPGQNTNWVPMCVSNPDLHQFILNNAWDGGNLLRLGEADSKAYCQCATCMSWDGPQPAGAKARIVSDRYARFWKTMYDLAVVRNPNVKVATFLYVNYFPAPLTNIQLNENIYGEFVPWSDFMVWYPATETELEWQRQQWDGWKRTGITLGYRPNHTKAGYAMPHVNTWQGGEFIRYAYQNGMQGIDFDALNGQWAVKGPEQYMYFRLLVHPDQTIASIREEYFAAFGPASSLIESYFDYWENYNHQLRAQGKWHDIRFDPKTAPTQYPTSAFPPAESILQNALLEAQKSPDSQFADRVRFLMAGLEHARLSANFIDMANKNDQNAIYALDDLIQFRRKYEADYISNYVYLALRCEDRYYGDKIKTLIEQINSQNTVFVDDFNRNPLGDKGGDPEVTLNAFKSHSEVSILTMGVSGSTTGDRVLQLFNSNTEANTGAPGQSFLSGDLSGYHSLFKTILKENEKEVNWTFNIRCSKERLNSFNLGNSNYAAAVVLVANNENFLAQNTQGYAVTLLKNNNQSSIQLVKFTNGLGADNNITSLSNPAIVDNILNYISVKIKYNPTTDRWSVQIMDDGSSVQPVARNFDEFTTPAFSVVDNTYTNVNMHHFGYFFNHGINSKASSSKLMIDNFKVNVFTEPDFTSVDNIRKNHENRFYVYGITKEQPHEFSRFLLIK